MELYHEYDDIVSCSNSLLSRAGSLKLEPGHELKPNGDLVRFFVQTKLNKSCLYLNLWPHKRIGSTLPLWLIPSLCLLCSYDILIFFKQTVERCHRPADGRAKPIKTNIFVILAYFDFVNIPYIFIFPCGTPWSIYHFSRNISWRWFVIKSSFFCLLRKWLNCLLLMTLMFLLKKWSFKQVSDLIHSMIILMIIVVTVCLLTVNRYELFFTIV